MHPHLCQLPDFNTTLHYRIMSKAKRSGRCDICYHDAVCCLIEEVLPVVFSKVKDTSLKEPKGINPSLKCIVYYHLACLYVSELILQVLHWLLTIEYVANTSSILKVNHPLKVNKSINVNKIVLQSEVLLLMLLEFLLSSFCPKICFLKYFAQIPFASLWSDYQPCRELTVTLL